MSEGSGIPGAESSGGNDNGAYGAARTPFPFMRLLYAVGFGVAAWFVFWIVVIVAIVQFVMVALNGRMNEELRGFSIDLVQYLWELVAFITFVRDEQPFPIGPFPKRH